MTGVDTNVLVRVLTGDGEGDEIQRAAEFLDGFTPRTSGFVPLIVLVELWWVLGAVYGYDTFERCDALEKLMQVKNLRIEDADVARRALAKARKGAEFSDALIYETAVQRGCSEVRTFDERAVRRVGMTLVPGR
jgi:predicted nucleic-acid-binding protein